MASNFNGRTVIGGQALWMRKFGICRRGASFVGRRPISVAVAVRFEATTWRRGYMLFQDPTIIRGGWRLSGRGRFIANDHRTTGRLRSKWIAPVGRRGGTVGGHGGRCWGHVRIVEILFHCIVSQKPQGAIAGFRRGVAARAGITIGIRAWRRCIRRLTQLSSSRTAFLSRILTTFASSITPPTTTSLPGAAPGKLTRCAFAIFPRRG